MEGTNLCLHGSVGIFQGLRLGDALAGGPIGLQLQARLIGTGQKWRILQLHNHGHNVVFLIPAALNFRKLHLGILSQGSFLRLK